jgi:hypothetical protein
MAQNQGVLLEYPMLNDILEQLSDYPLYPTTLDELHYKVRNRIKNDELLQYVIQRYREQRLCIVYENIELREPQVICSLGIRSV